MKAFRFFGLIVLTIMMGINFSACSSDDDNGSSPENVAANLEGTWGLVKETGWYYNNSDPSQEKKNYEDSYDPYNPKTDCVKLIISKTDDKTYSIKSYIYDRNSWGNPEYGKYDTTTGKITDSDGNTGTIQSLDAKTLVIKSPEIDYDSQSVIGESTQTYTRMK